MGHVVRGDVSHPGLVCYRRSSVLKPASDAYAASAEMNSHEPLWPCGKALMAMWQGAHPSSRQMYLRAFTCPGQILVHGRVVHLRRVGDAAGSGIGARLCGGVHGRNHLFLSRARESAQTGIFRRYLVWLHR